MNRRHPSQTEILTDPQRSFRLSAATQMKLTDVCVFCLLCVCAVGSCERGGLFLYVLYFIFAISCGCVVSVCDRRDMTSGCIT